MSWRDRET